MSKIISRFIIINVFFILLDCEVYNNRPKIKTSNGDLILEPAFGKNIILRPNGPKSTVFVGDLNISTVNSSQPANNDDFTSKSETTTFQNIIQRLEKLEQQHSEIDFINTGFNLTLIRRKLNRLSANVLRLQSQISNSLIVSDKCADNPCQNGGTCLNLVKDFHCLCPSNWEGKECNQDVNECRNFAGTDLGCQNGATCINRPGSYECLCRNGWYGLHCTRKAKDCSEGDFEMCGYGICLSVSTGTGIKCICNQGWTNNGTDAACLIDVNECESGHGLHCSINPKVNCINVPGSFRCESCPSGYEGDGYVCTDVDECTTFQNGGCSTNPLVTCHNTLGSRICGPCPPGYVGDGITCTWRGTCNINRGGCHPSAQCIENPGLGGQIAQCICSEGMNGDGIGLDGCYVSSSRNSTQLCQDNPCGNHGQCLPRVKGYTCICFKGYGGAHCDITINFCLSNPCRNGGTCRPDDSTRGYRCECTARYTGDHCQSPAKTCGGFLSSQEGNIIYPLTNNSYYNHNSRCAWVIQTAPDKVINVTFTKFAIEENPDCSYDFLQIHDGRSSASQLIGRFCGNSFPKGGNIISSHNYLYFWFRSDESISKSGFALHWNTINPICGGEVDAKSHGHISSPGSPGKYPPNRDCFWHVTTQLGKRIQLHFFELDIEAHKNCSFDYLAIYDGEHTTDPLINKYCNASQPAPIQSAGSDMLIHFHSDGIDSGNGFQISFATIEGVPGCGGYFTEDKGEITSPTYDGKYLNNMLCEYKIKSPVGTKIIIKFKRFKLETSFRCKFDYLKIYDGPDENSKLVGTFCGFAHPKSYTSSSNSLFLKFQSDASLPSDGFQINYETICQEYIQGDSGTLKSPGYPFNYTSNKLCDYIISTTPGKAIELVFQEFDIEDNKYFECLYDYVEVRDGHNEKSRLIGKFCGAGKPPVQISTHNYMFVRFHSDMSVGGAGFYANYTSIDVKCGGIYRDTTGLINYPSGSSSTYERDQTCTWYLEAPAGQHIKITWNRFELESSTSCQADYVEISEIDYNNTEYTMPKFCGNRIPPTMITSNNRLKITFKSDNSVQFAGFSISYTFLNEKIHCGGIFVRTRGFITSPGWPGVYEPNRDCIWTITVPYGQQIKLNFSYFDLERPIRLKCGDYLEIRNGGTENSPLIGRYCGNNVPSSLISTGNSLYLRFFSDFYLSANGFKIDWDGTLHGCGGTLTASTGSITSPNYPFNYYENAECFYRIVTSHGSRINIVFRDLDLEKSHLCSDDYIEIFDGRDSNALSLGKYCSEQFNTLPSVETSTNYAFIKFRSDFLLSGKGFSLNYNTICQNTITGSFGIIESPDFPNNYQNNLNCSWKVNVPLGNTINITFTHFDIFKNFYNPWRFTGLQMSRQSLSPTDGATIPCRQDYVQILESSSDSSKSNRLCGTTIPTKLQSKENSVVINFVTRSFTSRTGFRLEWVKQGCGGHIQRGSGTVNFETPSSSTAPIECEWIIETPSGTGVSITFSNIYMSETPNCTTDAIELFNGNTISSPLLLRTCHQHFSMAEASTTNIVLLRFVKHSDLRDVRFTGNFYSKLSNCGGRIASRSGTINSINYPKNYDNNIDCLWTLEVPIHHRVELNIIDLDLYSYDGYIAKQYTNNNTECSDFIKIYDGSSIISSNYSHLICPNSNITQFISKSNIVTVQFITDSYGAAKGFKANFKMACGAIISAKYDGILENNNFGTYTNSCIWTIVADKLEQKVTLTLTHLSLSRNNDIGSNRHCPTSFLRVLDGDDEMAPLIGEYCGHKVPSMLVSHGNAITIELGSYDGNVNGKFSAHYTTLDTACGGELTSEAGCIASPNYPNSYPGNINCEWSLKTSPGNRVYVTFEHFDLEDSDNCNEDYLEIRENNGGGRLLGLYCGKNIPVNATTASKLYIKFHSDDVESAQGFLLHYEFVHGNDINGLSSGEVASPLYPHLFEGTGEYKWRITTTENDPLLLIIDQLEIPVRSVNCYNSLSIYDGFDEEAPLLKQLCGVRKFERTDIRTSSNMVYIKLKLDETNTGSLFYIRWRVADRVSESDEVKYNCGTNGTYKILAGSYFDVKSPKFPNNYDNNLNCQWIFKATPGRHLTLKFNDISLEEQPGCFADYISVYISSTGTEDWKPIKEKICDSELSGKEFTAPSYIKIIFVTDMSQTSKGFSAVVKSQCGGAISSVSGVINPTWDDWKNMHSARKCEWVVKVRSGRTLSLHFEQFNLTNSNDRCDNYVVVRNGDSNEAPLLNNKKYCSDVSYSKITSSSNAIFISYNVKLHDISGHRFQTFKLRFEEQNVECGVTSSLDSNHRWETINSPNFPSVPTPYSECVWVFTGPPGEVLRIDFIDRFDLERSNDCTEEYVEIRDGLSELAPLRGRYCDERPGTVKTTSNIVYIKYVTQLQNPRDGFKANVTIDVCGGTIVANTGEISSPGYPHLPILPDGTVCEWKIIGYSGRVFRITQRDLNLPESYVPCESYVTVEETLKFNNTAVTLMKFCNYDDDTKFVESTTSSVTIKLVLGKKDTSRLIDSLSDYRGFRLTFNSTRPICGGSISASEGFLTTPAYPLQTSLRYCQWLITAPNKSRRIRLEILDSDSGLAKIGVFNDLNFMTSINNTTAANVFESSNNKLAIYLWLPPRVTEHRFKAKFTSNDEALCGGSLTGTSGELLSPLLDRSSTCEWHYLNDRSSEVQNKTIYLDVSVHSPSTKNRCRFFDPKLVIKSIVRSGVSFVRTICGNKTAHYRIPALNMDLGSFQDSKSVFSFHVKWQTYPCGGVVSVSESNVNVLNFPSNYNGSLECAWLIFVPYNTRIEIKLQGSFKLDCAQEFLQISQGLTDNPVTVREYCKDKMQETTLTSKFSFTYIQYHSEEYNSNLKLMIHTVNNICGGLITKYENIFMSPNFPNNYKENQECSWEIKADLGSRISLRFIERFVIEQKTNCTKDAVIIYDWKDGEYTQVARLCGRELPPVYNSTSERMKVVFRTDSDINLDGFKAIWSQICGGNLTATNEEKFLYSPNYPMEYPSDSYCLYTISATEQKIILEYIDFDIEGPYPKCNYDNLTVTGLNSYDYGVDILCGSKIPHTNTFLDGVNLIFSSDRYVQRRGFKISYKLFSCGGEITEPKVLSSPMETSDNYESYMNCTWIIRAPTNKIVVLKFFYIDLEDSTDCSSDYLTVYNGLTISENRRVALLCGHVNSITILRSFDNNMVLSYITDFALGYKGFKVSVSFSYDSAVGCGGDIELNTSSTYLIKSPLIGKNTRYEPFLDCHWNIKTSSGRVIHLEFISFDIAMCRMINQTSAEYNKCDCDVLECRDGLNPNSLLIGSYCGSVLPPSVTSSGNLMSIRFSTDGDIESSGFTARLSVQESSCGQTTYILEHDKRQRIKTPGYDSGTIPRGEHCVYFIHSDSYLASHIRIQNIDLQEGTIDKNICTRDKLVITNIPSSFNESLGKDFLLRQEGGEFLSNLFSEYIMKLSLPQQFVFCGKKQSVDLYVTGDVQISVQTSAQTDTINHRGVDLEISYASRCPRNYSEPQGRISVTSLSDSENQANECFTLITAPENYTISVYFLSVSTSYWNDEVYLDVFDGNKTSSKRLIKMRTDIEDNTPVFSTGRYLLLHNHGVAGDTMTFDLNYVTTNKGRGCGGKLHNIIGQITSPLYPDIFRKVATCEWELETPIGTALHLHFKTFDLGRVCDQNYVEIVNRAGQVISTYCSETPADYTSDDNYVKIVFKTTMNNAGTGWVAFFIGTNI